MKRFAGMLAVALATAAQSQTATSNQMPTPVATEATSPAPIAASTADAAPSSEAAAGESTAPQTPSSNQAPTRAAAETTSRGPIAASNTGAPVESATAQAPTASQSDAAPTTMPAADQAHANGAHSNAAQANVDQTEVARATSYLKAAAADFTNCWRASACKIYFDSFGVAIPFADGSIVPFSHVQRLSATSRECVKKAKALEEEGNRSLAVQWAMAARIENRTIRDWLGNHPDAVLAALRQVTVL